LRATRNGDKLGRWHLSPVIFSLLVTAGLATRELGGDGLEFLVGRIATAGRSANAHGGRGTRIKTMLQMTVLAGLTVLTVLHVLAVLTAHGGIEVARCIDGWGRDVAGLASRRGRQHMEGRRKCSDHVRIVRRGGRMSLMPGHVGNRRARGLAGVVAGGAVLSIGASAGSGGLGNPVGGGILDAASSVAGRLLNNGLRDWMSERLRPDLFESLGLCHGSPVVLLGLSLELELSVPFPALALSLFLALNLPLGRAARLLFPLAGAGGRVRWVGEAVTCRRGFGPPVRRTLLGARLARVGALLDGAHRGLGNGIFASGFNAFDRTSGILLAVLGVGDVVPVLGHGVWVRRGEASDSSGRKRWCAGGGNRVRAGKVCVVESSDGAADMKQQSQAWIWVFTLLRVGLRERSWEGSEQPA
jgi:hypothetical protein